jgi:hypothetical protein
MRLKVNWQIFVRIGSWNNLWYHSRILLHGIRKTTINFWHRNECSTALFYIYSLIACLLSHCCAYESRNQNSRKAAWGYTAVYLNFYFHTWVQSIATDVDTKHTNKHQYIYDWFISLQEGMTTSISDICVTKYRVSVFDINYEKKNVLTQRQYWTRSLSL